jgi:hypothetical protein
MAFSIASEHIENLDEDNYDLSKEKEKQDCELKAFSQLHICPLLDSLYTADSVMDICKEYGWMFIICYKEGSISSVYEEFLSLPSMQDTNNCN